MHYEKLCHKPGLFERFVGLSIQKFNELVKDITPLWKEAEIKRLKPERIEKEQ